jgi:L,D-peptidoglycan transpeptidase YkuD (ErfK/YbiS/YcfS/YnhG family)
MEAGRLISSCAALVAVVGGVVVAVGMGRANDGQANANDSFVMPSASARSYVAASTIPTVMPADPATSAAATTTGSATAPTSTTRATTTPAHPAPVRAAVPKTSTAIAPTTPRTHARTSAPAHVAAPVRGGPLPVGGSTSGASRVITVVAHSYGSTTATLQAWDRAPGGGWLKHGSAIGAHVGSQGLTTSPSEFRSATPIGSFSLTQAFGALSNPGTALPYFRTDASDWWISEKNSMYNTHQRCSPSSRCGFTQGDPNEHLVAETPYYNYAAVIDTPSGGAAYPHGSAFFLHVTDGAPTAGCVAIPQSSLVSLLRWLAPSAHPRIIIGVT